jgi:ammonia channel protein AmtB
MRVVISSHRLTLHSIPLYVPLFSSPLPSQRIKIATYIEPIISGDCPGGFIGETGFALSDDRFILNDEDLENNDFPKFFQKMAFVATSVTIVSGCVAERCTLNAYFVYSFFIAAFIYPVVACWCWGNGFMSPFREDTSGYLFYGARSNNFVDFAGSGVVHMVGGLSGLVGTIMMGPRLKRFNNNGESQCGLFMVHLLPPSYCSTQREVGYPERLLSFL